MPSAVPPVVAVSLSEGIPEVRQYTNWSGEWLATCPHCGKRASLGNPPIGSLRGSTHHCQHCAEQFHLSANARYV